jgi:hypothetical protein
MNALMLEPKIFIKRLKTPAKEENSARHSKRKRQLLIILFHITFVVNVVNDTYGTWTSLKVVLLLLNVNHYRLLKS